MLSMTKLTYALITSSSCSGCGILLLQDDQIFHDIDRLIELEIGLAEDLSRL